jgi:hypothetical protein
VHTIIIWLEEGLYHLKVTGILALSWNTMHDYIKTNA